MDVESATNFNDLPLRAHVSPASAVRTARVFRAPAALAFLLQPLPRQGGWDARRARVDGTPPTLFLPRALPGCGCPAPTCAGSHPGWLPPPALLCPAGHHAGALPPLGVSFGSSFGHGPGAALRGARLV